MSEITVITCSHNPRPAYLAATIRGLMEQSLCRTRWEHLLIDNASSSDRLPKAELSWHPQARIIREEMLGLTPARLRGIREAQGEILVFVDDDNILHANYLEETLRIAKEWPFLGSWSGQCRPEFEEPPPVWTRPYWGNLVIREFDSDRWSNLPLLSETMPCGAGLCVRRQVADRYVQLHDQGKRSFQFDRRGDSLMSGGDNDLAACACDVGLGVGLICSLQLTHMIPRERVRYNYLARLIEGIYYSGVLLSYERGGIASAAQYRVRFRDWLRASLYPWPHRGMQFAVLRGRRKGWFYVTQRG